MIASARTPQDLSVRIAPARAPRGAPETERLLVIDPLTRRFGDFTIAELTALLHPGDVLVVNDAATLPASLRAEADLELRLVSSEPDGTFRAVCLGAGDYRLATEARGSPRALQVHERLELSPELSARVVEVDATEPRLVGLRFETSGAAFWSALYRAARPIQYSYLSAPVALWDVQNRFGARPWAFELPSAGRPLTFRALFELERRGIAVTYVTHAAGVSSTGSASLDARLPLPERYEVSTDAGQTLAGARSAGGRVIGVGTSVVRALESAVSDEGAVQAGSGSTRLLLGPEYRLRAVDGLLTGLHEPGTSHFDLLEAFAPRWLLLRAIEHAAKTGYLQHEFGDSCLVLAGALAEPLLV